MATCRDPVSRSLPSGSVKGALQKWIERPFTFRWRLHYLRNDIIVGNTHSNYRHGAELVFRLTYDGHMKIDRPQQRRQPRGDSPISSEKGSSLGAIGISFARKRVKQSPLISIDHRRAGRIDIRTYNGMISLISVAI